MRADAVIDVKREGASCAPSPESSHHGWLETEWDR